jgi:uncharacterized membrane protein
MNVQENSGQPSTVEVLAEVERRRAEANRVDGVQRRIVVAADRFVFWLTKHWLAVFNTLALLYVGLPILAPVLLRLGLKGPGMTIYMLYNPLCNQLPQRSWFLFGPQLAYTLGELGPWIGDDPLATHFVGNEVVGYKMALCQRCVAIHGAIFLAGLLYAGVRRRVRPLPIWAYIVFGLLPMAADGGFQFLSYALPFLLPSLSITPYETTAFMRTLTGTLFGVATVWLAYPHMQETMDDFQDTLQERFGWE